MAQPERAGVSTLFDRLMERDGAAWVDLFAPSARLWFWFGDRAGRPQTPAEAQKAWLSQPPQRTTESLVVCALDEAGRVTRLEEFADPSMARKGPRPVPPPATPPSV
eukprot:gene15368-2041_t